MKKINSMFLTLICLCIVSGCGNVSKVKREIGDSDVYSKKEINQAMNVVERYFFFNLDDCTLLELTYDEEFSNYESEEWAKKYNADRAIVLLSTFKDSSSVEDYFMWILTQNDGERWYVKTYGY